MWSGRMDMVYVVRLDVLVVTQWMYVSFALLYVI
jgi:hypothetical protein